MGRLRESGSRPPTASPRRWPFSTPSSAGTSTATPSAEAVPAAMSGAEGEGRAGGPIAGRVVVALGGNALLRRGETPTIAIQRANLARAANALAAVVAQGWEIVVTHGNGPQVGLLAIEAELAASVVPPPPLDVLGAESQGQIGYLLAAALEEAFAARGVEKRVAVVL